MSQVPTMTFSKQNGEKYTKISVSKAILDVFWPPFLHKKWEEAFIREGAFIRINKVVLKFRSKAFSNTQCKILSFF